MGSDYAFRSRSRANQYPDASAGGYRSNSFDSEEELTLVKDVEELHDEPEFPELAALEDEPELWHVHLQLTREEIARLAESGLLKETSLTWQPGRADWAPVSAIHELRGALSSPARQPKAPSVPPAPAVPDFGSLAPRGSTLPLAAVAVASTSSKTVPPLGRIPTPPPPPAPASVAPRMSALPAPATPAPRMSAPPAPPQPFPSSGNKAAPHPGAPLWDFPAPGAPAAAPARVPEAPRPPPAPAPTPHRSAATNAPLVSNVEVDPAMFRRSRRGPKRALTMALVVGALGGFGWAAFAGPLRSFNPLVTPAPAVAAPAAKKQVEPVATKAESPAPKDPEPAPESAAAAAPDPTPAAAPEPAEASTAQATPAAQPNPSHAEAPTAAANMPTASGAKALAMGPAPAKTTKPEAAESEEAPAPEKSEATAAFDPQGASRALDRALGGAASCIEEGARVPGKAQVTFAPTGKVVSATLARPMSDPAVERCVLGTLKKVRVPSFEGSSVTVSKSFRLKRD